MAQLRVAVIGAGSIARRYHLPALKRLATEIPDISLAAVCDIDIDLAQQAREGFGFQSTYGDYRKMLDAVTPDAVWVLVPYPRIRDVAGFTLGLGYPTLMEKPPGDSAREAAELADIAARHNTPNQVALNRRYAPLINRMKALLSEAGPVDGLSCQFYRHNRRESRFAYGTGLHGIDALRFLGPGEIIELETRRTGPGAATITLVYENGSVATMDMRPCVGARTERYTAHAGDRTVIADGLVDWLTHYPGFLHCYDAGALALTIENDEESQTPGEIAGFYGEDQAFLENLLKGTVPKPSLQEALRSVELAESVDLGISRGFPA